MSNVVISTDRAAEILAALLFHATSNIQRGRDGRPTSMSALNSVVAHNFVSYAVFDPEPIRLAIPAVFFDWQRLNAASFAHRYPGEPAPTVRPVRPFTSRAVLSPIGLLKGLHLIESNCDSDHGHAASFAILQKLIGDLEHHLVTNLPDYAAADWF